jgi:hypothetical protein
MRKEQKIVAAGAASGVATMALGVWILTAVLPVPLVDDALAERLTYALSANVFALLPFFVMLVTVGNARFRSDAIDPTRHAESRNLEIDGRVADNTLQQNFVFAVVSLALSTIVAAHHLQVVWGLHHRVRDRALCVLGGLPHGPAVPRARDGGDGLPEPGHDPVRRVLDLQGTMSAAHRHKRKPP